MPNHRQKARRHQQGIHWQLSPEWIDQPHSNPARSLATRGKMYKTPEIYVM